MLEGRDYAKLINKNRKKGIRLKLKRTRWKLPSWKRTLAYTGAALLLPFSLRTDLLEHFAKLRATHPLDPGKGFTIQISQEQEKKLKEMASQYEIPPAMAAFALSMHPDSVNQFLAEIRQRFDTASKEHYYYYGKERIIPPVNTSRHLERLAEMLEDMKGPNRIEHEFLRGQLKIQRRLAERK